MDTINKVALRNYIEICLLYLSNTRYLVL